MKSITAILILTSLTASCAFADAINVNLGTADPFAVLAGSTVTNTGPSFGKWRSGFIARFRYHRISPGHGEWNIVRG
jgi:hypothetical protein